MVASYLVPGMCLFIQPSSRERYSSLSLGVTDPNEVVGAVREPNELDLLTQPFERHEILLRLLYRTAKVGFAVHEEH